jgi:hypothetical protein
MAPDQLVRQIDRQIERSIAQELTHIVFILWYNGIDELLLTHEQFSGHWILPCILVKGCLCLCGQLDVSNLFGTQERFLHDLLRLVEIGHVENWADELKASPDSEYREGGVIVLVVAAIDGGESKSRLFVCIVKVELAHKSKQAGVGRGEMSAKKKKSQVQRMNNEGIIRNRRGNQEQCLDWGLRTGDWRACS